MAKNQTQTTEDTQVSETPETQAAPVTPNSESSEEAVSQPTEANTQTTDSKPTGDSESKPKQEASQEPPTDDQPEVDKRVVPNSSEYTLPEGVPIEVGKFAHENDMTQAQLDATLTKMSGYMQASDDAQKAHIRAEGEKLVTDWGDQASANINIAKRALTQVDSDGALKSVLESTGYANHPVVLNHFLAIGQMFQEGGFLKGSNNTPAASVSAAQALYGTKHPSVN